MSALITLSSELTEAILQQYGELQKLNLSSNGLQNIENISRLNTLEKLNLSNNDLIDIRPLSVLLSLKELDLSVNRILDASPLKTLTALEVLDLRENAVVSVEGLRGLSSLPQLRSLLLEGNPVCDTVGYAASVMLMLPSLREIDGTSRSRLLESLQEPHSGSHHDDDDGTDDNSAVDGGSCERTCRLHADATWWTGANSVTGSMPVPVPVLSGPVHAIVKGVPMKSAVRVLANAAAATALNGREPEWIL